MKVLLINGSPKPKNTTYTALKEVADAIEAEGIETEIVQMGAKPICGCIACGKCSDGSGRCVIKNDVVNEILEKAEKADGFIFGTPVYYASPNGSLLALMDRMFYAGNCFAYKPGSSVAVARRAGTTAALDAVNKYFTISNMPVVPSQYWNMVHGFNPDDAAQDKEGMQTMRVLGRNMAWLLKSIEAGKKAGVPMPKKEKREMTHFIQ